MEELEELSQFIKYRDVLEKARKERVTDTFFNDSAIHEEFVIKELFNNAKDCLSSNKTIYMYCGKMSAFRDDMKTAVEKKKEEYRKKIALIEDPNEKNKKEEELKAFDPYKNLMDSVDNFFKDKGKLQVIVDEDIDSIKNEEVWDKHFKEHYKNNQLIIHRLNISSVLEHFVLSDRAYRMEISHEDKTAVCCFNNKDYADVLLMNYNSLCRSSQQVIIN